MHYWNFRGPTANIEKLLSASLSVLQNRKSKNEIDNVLFFMLTVTVRSEMRWNCLLWYTYLLWARKNMSSTFPACFYTTLQNQCCNCCFYMPIKYDITWLQPKLKSAEIVGHNVISEFWLRTAQSSNRYLHTINVRK